MFIISYQYRFFNAKSCITVEFSWRAKSLTKLGHWHKLISMILAAFFFTHVSQAIEALNANVELKAVEVELREL